MCDFITECSLSTCKLSLQEELDSLVETRDLARKNLHEKLTDCVQELEVMPLDDRHNCVSVSHFIQINSTHNAKISL